MLSTHPSSASHVYTVIFISGVSHFWSLFLPHALAGHRLPFMVVCSYTYPYTLPPEMCGIDITIVCLGMHHEEKVKQMHKCFLG